MTSLILPEVVGVTNVSQLVSICNLMHASSGPVELDCSRVRFFDPLGMTLLLCSLETLEPTRRISMPWLSSKTTSYLERMDFFERLDIESVDIPRSRLRRNQSANLLEITRLSGPERSEAIGDQLASSIAAKIAGQSPEASAEQYYYPLRYALCELLENALTHARREGQHSAEVWVTSQYYPNPERVHLAVVDNGCGFLATLKHHPELKDQTHSEAILAALKAKVSCNRDIGPFLESYNEGVGLTTTVRISKGTGGAVHILSGNAMVFESGSDNQKRHNRASLLSANWNGVAISATFEPRKLIGVRVGDYLPPVEQKTTNVSGRVALRFDD